jgi:uncharacterized protein with FMN-binding domain
MKGVTKMKKYMIILMSVLVLSLVLVGCSSGTSEETAYVDGTYEGQGEGMHPLKVSVEVKDGKIASVTVTEQQETEGVSDPALEQIPAAIVENNSTDVDVVSGATLTSNGIIEAVNNALEQAK